MSDYQSINVDQFLKHSPETVWRALTDPELLAQWWAPNDIVPVVGEKFTFTFADWGVQKCTILRVDEPHTLAYTFGEGVLDSTITWTLVPEGDGTRLLLEHAGFDLDTPIGKTGFSGMGAGWPGVVAQIDVVLADDRTAAG